MIIKNKSINIKSPKIYDFYTIQNVCSYDSDLLIADDIEGFDELFIRPEFMKELQEYTEFLQKVN